MRLAESFAYIETTIPAGVTVAQYRATRPRPSRRWRRLRRAMGVSA